jgi:hypothetical protein
MRHEVGCRRSSTSLPRAIMEREELERRGRGSEPGWRGRVRGGYDTVRRSRGNRGMGGGLCFKGGTAGKVLEAGRKTR